jgi:hypothetical protein
VTIEDDIGFFERVPASGLPFLVARQARAEREAHHQPNSGHEIHKEQPQLVIASCPRRCGARSASFTARRIAPSENGLVMSQALT